MGAQARLPGLLGRSLPALVLAVGLAQAFAEDSGARLWGTSAVAAAFAAAMLLCRTWLWAAVAVVSMTVLISAATGLRHDDSVAEVIACLVALFSAGYAMRLWQAVLALLVLFVPVAVASPVQGNVLQYAWLAIIMGGAWGVGRALKSRRRLIEDLRATTAALERNREELADRAVTQERIRIARDIHDVVAHSVTVMLVQATAAERTMHRGGPDAMESIRAVQDTARDAIVELRRMLGVLRADDGSETPAGTLAPQPGLGDVEDLVAHFRDAGLGVEYTAHRAGDEVASSVQITAYRVVQEGLTNVLKHSASPRARVRIADETGALVVEVHDGGPSRHAASPPAGHGIAGMRERLAVHGGILSAGTTPTGGFSVVARLPLGEGL